MDKLVDWIIANRKSKAFKGYTREMIAAELNYAQSQNGLFVYHDSDGNITGVIVAQPLLYVKQILVNKDGIVKTLCETMKARFPFPWAATRKSKYVIYNNVNRMIELYTKIFKKECA